MSPPSRRNYISTTSIFAPLLLLLTSHVFAPASAVPWPFGNNNNNHIPQTQSLDVVSKYWPEGTKPSDEVIEELKRRHERREVHGNGSDGRPLYVRKMPPDEEAKFYHYDDPDADLMYSPNPNHIFIHPVLDADGKPKPTPTLKTRSGSGSASNPHFFLSPHGNGAGLAIRNVPPAQIFARQDWKCPDNYYACTSINAPQYCCRADERCERIEDTGMGSVGCCPNGQQCTGPLTGCSSDQVTCSASEGGGCCIKGYKCSKNGCIPDNGGQTHTPTTQGAQTTQACSQGFYACPSTLAGGCCPTGRACGLELCPTTETGQPQVTGNLCPTGFYSCAPRFNGGCCRVGRDCGMTNCPARTSGGATVTQGDEVKTTPTSVYSPTGVCQQGWHSCPPSLNGDCCPSGYDCAVTDCPANTLGGVMPPVSKAPFQTQSVTENAAMGMRENTAGVRHVVVVVGVVLGVNVFV